MWLDKLTCALSLLIVFSFASLGEDKPLVTVGSKIFPESYVLAEIMSLVLEEQGYPVKRKYGLGGTAIAYEALTNQKIDVYPEYTGTLSHLLIKRPELNTYEQLNPFLHSFGLKILKPLGFENNYGLAVTSQFAEKYKVKTISDLSGLPFRSAINFESMNREDGWKALVKLYDLELKYEPIVLEQTLAFEALAADKADVMVIYTTDGKIKKFGLKVLEDNLKFTPSYEAMVLGHVDVSQEVFDVLSALSGKISQTDMLAMNERVDVEQTPYEIVAREYLESKGMIAKKKANLTGGFLGVLKKIYPLALEHIYLVLVSTLAASLVAIPLGVLLFRYQSIAKPVLYLVGLLQTIPSLALLVYMIPLLGVTVEAALLALFLYSLLPILQNTYSGLQNVSESLVRAAKGIGLTDKEILMSIELPLSAPIILAGVRIATVINVGTATIAAFIGSGGLGELIVQGLTLNDMSLMQQGALPAALLAIVFNILFTTAEKRISYQ